MDFETHHQLKEAEATLATLHATYLAQHPQVRPFLQDFINEYLLQKPSDVYAFSKQYFASFAPKDAPTFIPMVITGPSGVGKGTLIKLMMEKYPDVFGLSVSHTTRAPRPGEIPAFHYHFSEREVMAKGIQNGEFLESAEVHGNFYGTSKKAVEDVIQLGKICILDIDVQGCESVKKSTLPCKYVFIKPPSEEELRKRLSGRGTETAASLEKRLNNAKKELAYADIPGFFTHILVNDSLESTLSQLLDIVKEDVDKRMAYLTK